MLDTRVYKSMYLCPSVCMCVRAHVCVFPKTYPGFLFHQNKNNNNKIKVPSTIYLSYAYENLGE